MVYLNEGNSATHSKVSDFDQNFQALPPPPDQQAQTQPSRKNSRHSKRSKQGCQTQYTAQSQYDKRITL